MASSVVLLGDQLPVPSQQGLRRDNAGDLGKSLSSQRFGLYGQFSTLIVIEAHSLATELFAKHPILLAKTFNDEIGGGSSIRRRRSAKPGKGRALAAYSKPIIATCAAIAKYPHLHADRVFGPYGVERV